ncbi:angiotensin-converting enzyme [Plakobranchus ocellatus]|uniref:Angiotensin-converting enzyme n=1 Tax=Plakobranchus ocellatus TaxID=259542 RepID=A0AAV3YUM8_9GAST|nr:angiotensin-converting enzyme [Plakobranchus ocellatus]
MTDAHRLVTALMILLFFKYDSAQETSTEFLARFEREAKAIRNSWAEADWKRQTNITTENQAAFVKASLEYSKFSQAMEKKARLYLQNKNIDLTADQRRQLTKIADIGTSAQTDVEKLERYAKIKNDMASIYSKAEVCLDSGEKCLQLDPGLTELLHSSRDCKILSAAWQGWRDQSGKKMKDLFTEYVQLGNEAVQILGYKDMGDYWKSAYETPTLEEDVAKLFEQIRPLYEQLHAYVRRRLKAVYGAHIFPSSGHIPAHILGNMWSQDWTRIGEHVKPFKDKQSVDVTDEMTKQGYTTKRMFETAEEFFYSLGFPNMTETFWRESMLERPKDRDVVCHASAWDMAKEDDFRIKMCTKVNHQDLMTIHHEMGHVQYDMTYTDLPLIYRFGANPGFQEAVGDTIALSVQTPQHLKAIGLLQAEDSYDEETDINFLMQMALDSVAFLPFSYLVDQWRWSVFRGDTKPESYNEVWWDLRCRFQGVSPPVKRRAEDFDPGAKYHVPANVPYIRYFVSLVLQFQFYKAACVAAGDTGPLHHCDFYSNPDAGHKLRSMLKLGSSKPWPDALEQMTGQREMDAQPLVEYFQPLFQFLKKENGEDHGWTEDCPDNPPPCSNTAQRWRIRYTTAVLSLSLSLITARFLIART